MKKCNMEIYKRPSDGYKGLCNEQAEWKHPRWPTGLFCDEHKRDLEDFFKSDWERIDKDEK